MAAYCVQVKNALTIVSEAARALVIKPVESIRNLVGEHGE